MILARNLLDIYRENVMKSGSNCQTCELMDICSFYWGYRNHYAVIERELINRYCHSGEEPEACARIRFLKENNESPLPYLTPEGDDIRSSENHESADVAQKHSSLTMLI